ncbi:hypothetical protein VIGAN_09101700 [Vigna angularis var. angularis]|uniref:Uncharacterized protein n=1 Tax=Vigna angularis var. angularis TaxID=157739 RepID=A0A0S3SXM8_PHAAN|nr:hypothetical protein VIGAN_09101700 [Vigna angularis var. angularis]
MRSGGVLGRLEFFLVLKKIWIWPKAFFPSRRIRGSATSLILPSRVPRDFSLSSPTVFPTRTLPPLPKRSPLTTVTQPPRPCFPDPATASLSESVSAQAPISSFSSPPLRVRERDSRPSVPCRHHPSEANHRELPRQEDDVDEKFKEGIRFVILLLRLVLITYLLGEERIQNPDKIKSEEEAEGSVRKCVNMEDACLAVGVNMAVGEYG